MSIIRIGGTPEIEIAFRRNARARRLSLRVSALDGRVTLTAPKRLAEAEAIAFARERREWILKARQSAPLERRVAPDAVLPVEGRDRLVKVGPTKAARLSGDVFEVPGQRPGLAAQVFLKALARDRLAQCVARYTAALDVSHKALTLRDTRSRWGSCTFEGRLMFSWRLAMAEPDVLDYVAAHEVAHLLHMDHSPAFWAVVEKLRPDWREARDWLRREGPGLHAIRFDD